MSGLPDIDVEDWEQNTEYSSGYDEQSNIVKVSIKHLSGQDFFLSLSHKITKTTLHYNKT